MQHIGERLESGIRLPVLHRPAPRRVAKKPPPADKWPTASNVVVHAASMRIYRTWIEDSGHHQRACAATKEPVRVLLSHGQEAQRGRARSQKGKADSIDGENFRPIRGSLIHYVPLAEHACVYVLHARHIKVRSWENKGTVLNLGSPRPMHAISVRSGARPFPLSRDAGHAHRSGQDGASRGGIRPKGERRGARPDSCRPRPAKDSQGIGRQGFVALGGLRLAFGAARRGKSIAFDSAGEEGARFGRSRGPPSRTERGTGRRTHYAACCMGQDRPPPPPQYLSARFPVSKARAQRDRGPFFPPKRRRAP